MDAGDEALVGDVEQRHTGGFVDAAGLRFDDAVLDLIGHAETVAAADAVRFVHQLHEIRELNAIQGNRAAFFKAHRHRFRLDLNRLIPEGDAHDRVDNLHGGVEVLEVLRFVRRAEHVGVGRIGLLSGHAVAEAFGLQERAHFSAAAEFRDERRVKPGLVDLQIRVREETVAVEALDIVALIGRTVAPDVHAILTHRVHEHRARHSAAERGRVVVGLTCGGDVEGVCLDRRNAFGNKLRTAVDQAGLLGTILHRALRNGLVVVFVRLAKIGRVGVGKSSLLLHPVQGAAGVETAGERNADLLADRNALENSL